MLRLLIPIPPSSNSIYKNIKGGRAKTKEYEAWREYAILLVNPQFTEPIAGEVIVDITVKRKSKNSDIDNRIKPTLDLLQKSGVLGNDKNVQEVRARWGDVPECVVEIWKVGESHE